ncbi:Uu.00g098760.m01.CDS01 [Anthostomella pinea]|uniref:Uu.00g098760.m01.CDS01 n=1 Tax=Anthostomella pinea TaxID=933095 RepID=A0AAI8VDC3_9PEZI|nr:Uu.00g098760.m01.CDS01 [Anthostomella pinea]
MSTPGCAINQEETEGAVIVTLSSRIPSSVHSRRLVLTRDSPSVRIGRASKIATKGFVPAQDNAWFDSPVMSRNHAEIFANFDTNPNTVFYKETKALHGTYITANDGLNKEVELPKGETIQLSNGDILRFGIRIFRSNQKFDPCAVDFLMEEKRYKESKPTSMVFMVPDDIDEDEDEYISEEDIGDSDDVKDITHLHSTSRLGQQSTPDAQGLRRFSIDLTVEDVDASPDPELPSSMTTGNAILSDFIDLTSEPDHDSDADTEAIVPHFPADGTSDPVLLNDLSISQLRRHDFVSGPIVDGRQGLFFAPSDQSSDEEEMASDYPDETGCGDEFPDIDDSSQVSDDSADDMSEISGDGQENSEESELASELASELGDEYGMDGFEEEDEDSLQRTPYDEDGDSSSSEEMNDPYVEKESSPESPPSSSPPPSANKEIDSKSAGAQTSGDSASTAYPFGLFNAARAPSPSDAAMFKSQPVLSQEPSTFRAQALGEKTGKFQYFEARENNRAVASHNDASVPMSAIRDTLAFVPDGTTAVPRDSRQTPTETGPPLAMTISTEAGDIAAKAVFEAPAPNTVQLTKSNSTEESAWSAAGEKFINNPHTEDLVSVQVNRQESPELDMTSAYTFQQSKLATGVKADHKVRRLPIEDLLAEEPRDELHMAEPKLAEKPRDRSPMPELEPTAPLVSPPLPSLREVVGTKRSFEEAFDAPELRVPSYKRADGTWAGTGACSQPMPDATPGHFQPTRTPARMSAEFVASDAVRSVEALPELAAAHGEQNDVRPSKRLRLAQAAACVALGGAAAFSYLVNSAPVF